MNNSVPYIVVVVLLVVAIGGYALVQGHATSSSQTGSASSSTFTATNVSLDIANGYQCGGTPPNYGTQCTPIPEVLIDATISVHATSPLSCLDFYVNGTMEGESCWNLVSLGFPYGECSGSGNQTTCTTIYQQNNNTQTSRTFPLSQQIISYNGTNNGLTIREGKSYLVTLIAHFENGSSSSISVTVVARVTDRNSTSPISVQTTTSTAK